ncbi:MAG: NUDIX domain-containing protein [Candidatus Omnitrophica bacterium]|nr:NUDIX domain-containing protein [Candidatus Omnitrophota bacterium]
MLNEDLFPYCPKCGAKEFAPASDKHFQCGACGFMYYFNPCGAAVGIVKDGEGRILLTRRARDPAAGTLDLPGGFIDFGETAEEALARELFEELHLRIRSMTYFCSMPNLYRYAEVLYHTIDFFFVCEAANLDELEARDEIAGFEFRAVEAIDLDEIGFDSIQRGLSKLKEEIASGRFRL